MDIQKNRHRRINLYKLYKGCERCGYNKHPSALCFDHLPNQKKNEITKNGYSKRSTAGGMFKLYSKKYSVNQLIAEIRKCRILCSNCHMELTHEKYKPESKKRLYLFWRRICYRINRTYVFWKNYGSI